MRIFHDVAQKEKLNEFKQNYLLFVSVTFGFGINCSRMHSLSYFIEFLLHSPVEFSTAKLGTLSDRMLICFCQIDFSRIVLARKKCKNKIMTILLIL